MMKKTGIALLLLSMGFATAYAQLLDGLSVDVNLDFTVFGMERNERSDAELRRHVGNFNPRMFFWPGHRDGDWISDAGLTVEYDGGFFGAAMSVGTTWKEGRVEFTEPIARFNALRAWVMPRDWLRFTAGVGIGAGFADGLGADPGLRVYSGVTQDTWDDSRDPDNITQDEGILLEFFMDRLSVAMAARYYNPGVFRLNLNPTANTAPEGDNRNTRWDYMDQREFSYGARIGYGLGDWGKVNLSYIIEWSNFGDERQNLYGHDPDGNMVPTVATAETAMHLFGAYASLTPPAPGFALTLAYNGIVTQYTDRFFAGGLWHDTAMPMVLQHAINLNARYTGINRWTFRTDHNVSFWVDKNYAIFGIQGIVDMGTTSAMAAQDFAQVDHLLVWNGVGVAYQLSDDWRLDLYVRNLRRQDTALGVQGDDVFQVVRNQLRGELRGIWQPRANLEMFVGIDVQYYSISVSHDINRRQVHAPAGFVSLEHVGDTNDGSLVFKVPMGIIVRMR